jgi:hypothetical protein
VLKVDSLHDVFDVSILLVSDLCESWDCFGTLSMTSSLIR